MSGDYAYVFDEYVNGTPERQARYIADFRINLANLRTVVGSELAGRVGRLLRIRGYYAGLYSACPDLSAEQSWLSVGWRLGTSIAYA